MKMKTIWIEDDYLLELSLDGKDDILMEIAQCQEKLSYCELYIAVKAIPVIKSLMVEYLLSQMRNLHESYLRKISCLGVNLREISRVHPELKDTCRDILEGAVRSGSARLEESTPDYRKHYLARGGDGYDVYIIDEWNYNSCRVSDWNEK